MKFKSILLLIVALSLLLCACNDTTITTEPESAPAPSASGSASTPSTLESPSEPVTFPRLVCKEGQWLLETGIREEDVPDYKNDSMCGTAWYGRFGTYKEFIKSLKDGTFTEEETGELKYLLTSERYKKGEYPENGALEIPDLALLEKFSVPYASTSYLGFEESRVYWVNGAIFVCPSVDRGDRPPIDQGPESERICIYARDEYSQLFHFLERRWEEGIYESAEIKEFFGLLMYYDELLRSRLYRIETEEFVAWIEYNYRPVLYVKEKNGLTYTCDWHNVKGERAMEQISAVLSKYGYELGK